MITIFNEVVGACCDIALDHPALQVDKLADDISFRADRPANQNGETIEAANAATAALHASRGWAFIYRAAGASWKTLPQSLRNCSRPRSVSG